jgi:hypothetical protein
MRDAVAGVQVRIEELAFAELREGTGIQLEQPPIHAVFILIYCGRNETALLPTKGHGQARGDVVFLGAPEDDLRQLFGVDDGAEEGDDFLPRLGIAVEGEDWIGSMLVLEDRIRYSSGWRRPRLVVRDPHAEPGDEIRVMLDNSRSTATTPRNIDLKEETVGVHVSTD